MLYFMRDKKFLTGTTFFFLMSVSFFFSSCATSHEKTQEDPVEDSPTADVAINATPYVLGPEDVVQVLVWKDDALTRTVMIRPDGKISLPLVGELQASGLTPGALASSVKQGLQKYYKEQPEVSVIVSEINSFSFFVLGEVNLPGKHILRRETTLLQALSLAGGFKQYADTKNILLLRKEGAIERRIKINYRDLISGKSYDGNLSLKSGDTIIVP